MVRTIDILPTLLDWLRISTDRPLDGRSLRAYLDGDEPSRPRGEVTLHASGLPGSAKHPGGGWQRYAVRSPAFKLLRVYQGPRLMSEEAYDLVRGTQPFRDPPPRARSR